MIRNGRKSANTVRNGEYKALTYFWRLRTIYPAFLWHLGNVASVIFVYKRKNVRYFHFSFLIVYVYLLFVFVSSRIDIIHILRCNFSLGSYSAAVFIYFKIVLWKFSVFRELSLFLGKTHRKIRIPLSNKFNRLFVSFCIFGFCIRLN